MTVGVFIDRLQEFRQGVLQYREMSKPIQGLSHKGAVGIDSSQANALGITLCQHSLLSWMSL